MKIRHIKTIPLAVILLFILQGSAFALSMGNTLSVQTELPEKTFAFSFLNGDREILKPNEDGTFSNPQTLVLAYHPDQTPADNASFLLYYLPDRADSLQSFLAWEEGRFGDCKDENGVLSFVLNPAAFPSGDIVLRLGDETKTLLHLTNQTQAEPHKPGDTDGNGQLNMLDATALLRSLGTTTIFSAESDYNGDGRVSVLDAYSILTTIMTGGAT